MSDESRKAARSDEPEVEGHLKALGAEEFARAGGPAEMMMARSGEPGDPEGSEVEGHLAVYEPAERAAFAPSEPNARSGEPEGPDVEGHMAPLGTEERPVRMPPSEESGKPEGSEVEGHVMQFKAAEPVRRQL
jgi:hypothetical protein